MENNNIIPKWAAKEYRSRRKGLEATDNIKVPKLISDNILLPNDRFDRERYEKAISNIVDKTEYKFYDGFGIVCSTQHHKLILTILDYVQQKLRLYKRGEIKKDVENEINKMTGSNETREYEQLIINSVDLAIDYFGKKKVGGTEVRKALSWIYDLSNYRMILLKQGEGFFLATPFVVPYLPLTKSRPKDFVIYVLPEFINTDKNFILIPRKQFEKLQHKNPLYINLLYLLCTKRHKCFFRIQKNRLIKMIAKYKRYKVKRLISEDYQKAITDLLSDGIITNYKEENKYKDTYAVFYFSEQKITAL